MQYGPPPPDQYGYGQPPMSHAQYAQQGLRFCVYCQAPTPSQMVTNPGPNHLVHALLSLFLCGLWLPVWLLIALLDKSAGTFMHCMTCGRRRLQ